jgi:hypothetical protein
MSRFLGGGTTGKVYREHLSKGTVIVKKFHDTSDWKQEVDYLSRFTDSRHICRMIAFSDDSENPFVIFEDMRGESLQNYFNSTSSKESWRG